MGILIRAAVSPTKKPKRPAAEIAMDIFMWVWCGGVGFAVTLIFLH